LKSYAFDETQFFKGIDNDGGCRKQTIRILKAFRSNKKHMHAMSNYVIKTALLNAADRPGVDWSQKKLADRVLGILLDIQGALEKREMPHKFDDRINVMTGIKKRTAAQVARFIEHMRGGNGKGLNDTIKKMIK
jgi:hypothetical protein